MAGWSESVWLNEDANQYEIEVQGRIAVLVYRRDGDVLDLLHTEVPTPLEGQGLGKALLKDALADIRERGLKVRPICPFVIHYFETHPEVGDLIA